jgi:8-oxo-dGTP diphosphatase
MPKKDMVTVNFRIAVKAFMLKDGKLLILRRSKEDIQNPGGWELPGGRLELGEDPRLGLMREIKEETGLYIDIKNPLNVRHFERIDGQVITMIIFLGEYAGGDIKLSKEHIDFDWIDPNIAEKKLAKFFHNEVRIYKEIFSKKI